MTASKVRYTLDNRLNNILGQQNQHGWIYEFEVWDQPVTYRAVINTSNSGPGSLRQAITDANADPASADVIVFNIPTSDAGYSGGVFTIRPTSELPVLVNNTIVDGTTQTAMTGNTNPNGPEIVINGSMQPSGHGLRLDDDNTVRGLVVNGFAGRGIYLSWEFASGGVANNNQIADCYVGTDPTG